MIQSLTSLWVAYIDFANVAKDSAVSLYVTPLHENIERTQLSKHGLHSLNEGYQNLIVLQTLSKGFGLAGIRCVLTSDMHPKSV